MRILQICSARAWGGGETHVAALVAGLRARGYEVFIASRRQGAFAAQADLHLPFVNAADLYTGMRLRHWLRCHSCDVVHAHLARDYPIACVALGAGTNPQLVCTRHLLYSLRVNPLYRRVDGWIATTAAVANTLDHLQPPLLRVIPNGVDMSAFPFRGYAPQAPLRLGLLGQIAPHKGHDDALVAMRLLGSGFRLHIAGEGEASYVRGLRHQAAGLAVEFRGFEPAAGFLAGIDVLLMPSWEEPFGLVMLEAMAAGVPVIATAAGGPASIVIAGQEATLVPPRDPSALAAAVRALTADPEAAAARARRARELIEMRYSAALMVERTEAFYRELISRERA